MRELRIDDLAREAGTTVRNVRAYQDRGILPPPRREGRVAVYGDAHLARLRLIARLLERGFTMANIQELVQAWERGRELSEVLGLEEAVTGPWSDEVAGSVDPAALAALFPDGDNATIERAVKLGYIVPEEGGDGWRVPSPRQLQAGAELVAAGIPLRAVLDTGAALRKDVDRVAARFVRLVADHVIGDEGPADAELPKVAEIVRRLRPLALMVVSAELARAMERHTLDMLGDQLAAALDLLPDEGT